MPAPAFIFLQRPSTVRNSSSKNKSVLISAFVLFLFLSLFSGSASNMSSYIALSSTFLLIYYPIILGASCYFPDQSIAGQPYLPCSGTTSDGYSPCCASGDQCTEHGYCFGNAGYIYRGGCTDITWQSPNCAQQCRDGTQSQLLEEHLFRTRSS